MKNSLRNTLWPVIGACMLVCCSIIMRPYACYAEDDPQVAVLTKQIMEAKTESALTQTFAALKAIYLKNNLYSEFVEHIKPLALKKKTLDVIVNYYIAESRYRQLKYLEEKQLWDEYFSQGNTYREEISEGVQKVITSTFATDPLHIYARLIFWQFHRDQQDVFHEQALDDLISATEEYAKKPADITLLKTVADTLLAYEEKGKSRQIYKLYVANLVTTQVSNETLEGTAQDFYAKGNFELAQLIYDVYIERITAATAHGTVIPALFKIAGLFSDPHATTGYDPAYAEKVFKKIEEIGGKEVFTEELLYTRAFSQEKAKEYAAAKDYYLQLLQRFPKTQRLSEVYFKIGIIATYALRDPTTGKQYFNNAAVIEPVTPQAISSLYQLGVVSQWEENFPGAKGYYEKVLNKAQAAFPETVVLAKARLAEIEEAKPLEFNLKIFLDVSLKEEYAGLTMTKLDLRGLPTRTPSEKEVAITATPYTEETGCMQVDLQYLWSGHTGKDTPSNDQKFFSTSYQHNGTKEINLVVVSPTGIIDRDFIMVDVE